MTSIEEFAAGFDEDPGFLDYAAWGPFSRAVTAEVDWQRELLSRARFGSTGALGEQGARARAAVADLLGFRPDQVVLQPDTSTGLMHAVFGLTGGVLVSPAEYPSLPFAAVRAEQSLSVTAPIWLETDHGRVTPGQIREQLTSTTVAVAVSLVDARTGHLADLDGIRQVIGDRLLIVDAVQGAGVVDVPFAAADIVAGGGHKWLRAGWSTGYLALSDRAVERLTPVFSGYQGVSDDDAHLSWDEVPAPVRAAAGFRITRADPLAAGRLAASLEELAAVGVGPIATAIAEKVTSIIDLA
ncbi:MAG TPA: aminotransferase class V-fold PLP-dependent enzyme, partial [Naasia sp.]